jgi:uncharacterized protein (TIGR02246 family)
MTKLIAFGRLAAAVALGSVLGIATIASAQEDKTTAEVRAAAARFVKAFDAGDAEALAKQFLPEGELLDEEGTVYRGQAEVKDLFKRYFEQFAGTRLTMDVESVRSIGPQLAIEEGTRLLVREKDSGRAQLRYIAVRAKVDGQWLLASIREFTDDPEPTPNDWLAPLAWLEGDWINEGDDAVVKISYRWSEDKNYLLGEYHVMNGDQTKRSSSQRIGWDPQAQKIRSWLFEADGGFSEARWTLVNDESTGNKEVWILKSTGTLADGQSGSATLRMTRQDKDHFQITGRERLIGDAAADDFEIVVTRRPPAAAKK